MSIFSAAAAGPSANRRAPIANASEDPTAVEEPSAPVAAKSPATHATIKSALKAHFLFSTLDDEDAERCVGAMDKELVGAGNFVIRQGDTGDKFYVLEAGTCDIMVNDQKVAECQAGDAFGELALMYNAPRAASIVATSPCTLWFISRRTFHRILAKGASSAQMARCEFLKQVKQLEPLSSHQISQLAAASRQELFDPETYIIRQGDEGDTFYLIEEGRVKCTHRRSETDDTETDLIELAAGDYFGEMALLLDEPRHANVIALEPTRCLTLNRDQFVELLGPMRDLLDRQMRIRVLKSVPLLSSLSDDELDTIAHALRVVVYSDGDIIIQQGQEGTSFFIINEGEVKCTKNGKELMTMSAGDFFGERALLRREKRAANIIARGRVECLVLDRRAFEDLLGDLQDIMDREIRRREAMQVDPKAAAAGDGAQRRMSQGAKPEIMYEDLQYVCTVGTGTFGRVKLTVHTPTNTVFAMKCMQKAQIVASHQQRNIMNEKNIVAECDHPFILKLMKTFADEHSLFMLLELVQGGELWTLLYEKFEALERCHWGGFQIPAARFYSSCVVSAFQYLHSMGVAYRDLKPENLLLDAEGYLKVVDFGFAKRIPFYKGNVLSQRSFTLCGTPEYLSPELVLSKGHNKSVDYWALGCLVYELLVGTTPFQDQQQPKIFEKVSSGACCAGCRRRRRRRFSAAAAAASAVSPPPSPPPPPPPPPPPCADPRDPVPPSLSACRPLLPSPPAAPLADHPLRQALALPGGLRRGREGPDPAAAHTQPRAAPGLACGRHAGYHGPPLVPRRALQLGRPARTPHPGAVQAADQRPARQLELRPLPRGRLGGPVPRPARAL
jgi:cGMP-dependent protein kinase